MDSTSVTISVSNPTVAAITEYTFKFTTKNIIPIGGKIRVTPPAEVVIAFPTDT